MEKKLKVVINFVRGNVVSHKAHRAPSVAKLQSKKKFWNRRCTQINADRENIWSLVYLIETTNIILHRQNLIKKSIFSRKIKKSYLSLMLILRILWPSLVQSIHLRAFAAPNCGSGHLRFQNNFGKIKRF